MGMWYFNVSDIFGDPSFQGHQQFWALQADCKWPGKFQRARMESSFEWSKVSDPRNADQKPFEASESWGALVPQMDKEVLQASHKAKTHLDTVHQKPDAF